MLALLLASTAFHLPSGKPWPTVTASVQAAVHCAQAVAHATTEDAAKAAWLAKNIPEQWTVGRVVSITTAPDVVEASRNSWLVPGAPILTLEAADEMANVALREASSRSFSPVSVCVLNASGRAIVTKTMLGCGTLSPDLAVAKASVCISLLCSSRELRDKYVNSEGIGPKMPQLLAMGITGAAVNQPLAPFPGGVLCRDEAQNLVCAIGVSGAASDEDEHCAITAAKSIGLVTEPASSQLADSHV